MDLATISILVKGKVQGVFFRQCAHDAAVRLHITGTVANLDNGDVQLIATGEPHKLDQLVEWCKEGSPRARVESVECSRMPLQSFQKFAIERK